MKNAMLVLFLLLMTTIVQAQSITLGGTVRSHRTAQPLTTVSVLLLSSSGNRLDSTTTDAFGDWGFQIPTTTVDQRNSLPNSFVVGQNYPNPFNPSTRIPFSIRSSGPVSFSVYNLLGQLMEEKTLMLNAGSYTIDWKTMGSAGVLFYSIEIDGKRETRKMIQLDGSGSGGFGTISTGAAFERAPSFTQSSIDSVRLVFNRHLYEPDTVTVPLIDGIRHDHLLDLMHDRAFVVDLHNDVLEQIVGHNYTYQIGIRNTTEDTDIPRLRDGGMDAQVFSVYVATAAASYYANSIKYLDSLKAQFNRNGTDISLSVNADSIATAMRSGKIAAIICCEGGECIEGDLNKLRDLYARGVRMMTITWNNRSGVSWARSHDSRDSSTIGLNGIGVSVIQLMDSLGIIIDVSHVGPKTISDILATTTKPIIASHSNARGVKNVTRNLTDGQILAIANNGGVIGINYYPSFVGTTPVNIDSVIKHIDYIRNLVGVDHIGLGADYDGYAVLNPPSPPTGLKDVSSYPALTEALLNRDYSREDVRKILGENFLRVIRSVCR